jgi:hypothetical protein
VLPELRARGCGSSRRAEQARHDVVHGKGAHLVVGIVGEDLALDEVRVLEDLRTS